MDAREQKQVQSAAPARSPAGDLDAQRLLFDTAINNMSQGLCFFDGEQRLIVCNTRYAEMYGLPPECTRPGTTLRQIVEARFAGGSCPNMTREEYLAWRDNVAVSNCASDTVVELTDGRVFAIHHRPMPDGGWVATHEDITERQRNERALREQRERLDVALNNMTHGLCMFDAEGRLIVLNARYAAMYAIPDPLTIPGTPVEEILNHRAEAGTGAADAHRYDEHLALARAGKASSRRVLLQDGRVMEVSHEPLRDGGWVATHEDVTASVQAEAQIAANAEILNATLENMDQGLLMVDAEGRVPVCNQRALELLDLPADLMASKPTFEAVRQFQLERGEFAKAPLTMRNWVQASGVEASHHVYERERPNGTVLEVRTVPLQNGGAVRTFTDITERKAAERKIEHMARHDPLTDLPNRILFREALEKRLAEVDRHGGSAAVLCLDLDGFKGVNDQFGHAAGDALLREVAARLRAVVRTEDTVARLGGDEFVVLKVGGGKASGAAILAQRIIEAIRADVRVESNIINVGVSVGIAIAPSDGVEVDQVLKRADMALYEAKAGGRNTYRFAEGNGRVHRFAS